MNQELEWEWLPCPICGSPDNQKAFSVRRRSALFREAGQIDFHYEQCVKCGLIYLNPRPLPLQMRRYYPDAHLPRDAWPPNHLGLGYWYRDIFVKPVDELPVSKERALDYVCRTGLFLRLLKERYNWREVYGVDPRRAWVEEARPVATDVFCGLIEEANFPDSFFDLITIRHTLEHFYNPTKALEEARRILKPGGFIVVEVPNIAGVGSCLFGTRWPGLFAPRHLYQFTPKTLCQLLERNGFKVHDMSCPPWPYYLAGSITDTVKQTPAVGRWCRALTRNKVVRDAVTAFLYSACLPVATVAALLKRGDEIVVTARVVK